MKRIFSRWLVVVVVAQSVQAWGFDPLNYNYSYFTSGLYGLYYTGATPGVYGLYFNGGVPYSAGYLPSSGFPLGYSSGFPLGYQASFYSSNARSAAGPGWMNPRDIEFGATGLGTIPPVGAPSARGAEFGGNRRYPIRSMELWGAHFLRVGDLSRFSFRTGSREMGLGRAHAGQQLERLGAATPAGFVAAASSRPSTRRTINWEGSGLGDLDR